MKRGHRGRPAWSESPLRQPKPARVLATIAPLFREESVTTAPDPFAPLSPPSPSYGGSHHLFPYTGAAQLAAHEIATLLCPPVQANDPHTVDVLRWPCESCILFAKKEIDALVQRHRAAFPRLGMVPDAENPRDSLPEASQAAPRAAQETPQKPRRQPRKKPRRRSG